MDQLPYLHREALDDAGRGVWDAITSTRGSSVINADGGLVGPFNAWLHAPAVGAAMSELGAVLRFGTSLDRRLLELAIITVGARWKAEFEWWAHAQMAREHGVPEAAIGAIGAGLPFGFDRIDERIVHGAASQLVAGGTLDDATYAEAHQLLGDRGMVELVSLCGYYTMVSFALNAFSVPLPPGVERAWPD